MKEPYLRCFRLVKLFSKTPVEVRWSADASARPHGMADRRGDPGTTAKSRMDRIYDRLRADILAGRLEPGQRLPFAELSKRYEASMGLLREALQRLTEQGLVESEVQQGFRVATVSAADLRDLTAARCELEGLALRHAIAEADMQW